MNVTAGEDACPSTIEILFFVAFNFSEDSGCLSTTSVGNKKEKM